MRRSSEISGLQRRCPRLGGPVTFGYCRHAESRRNPCFKVFDCWWDHFDVVAYFRQRLSPDDFNNLCNARPPEKTASLLDMIRQAQQRTRS
jgi:hypothetical protein